MEEHFTVRRAELTDLPAMWRIYRGCIRTIGQLGIDQWQKGFPNEKTLTEDINTGCGRLLCLNGEIRACFLMLEKGDSFYDTLGAAFWGDDRPYLAIHRVAVDPEMRRAGLGRAILDYCAERARQLGLSALYIDTHHGNIPMRTMLSRYGFRERGDMLYPIGELRIGYYYPVSEKGTQK